MSYIKKAPESKASAWGHRLLLICLSVLLLFSAEARAAEVSDYLLCYVGEEQGSQVFVYDYQTKESRAINRASDQVYSPNWSPQNELFVVSVLQQSADYKKISTQLYLMDFYGQISTQLTADPEQEFFLARWSPDGQQIAYVARTGRQSEIYLMDKDGGNKRQLTNNATRDTFPVWDPNDHNLLIQRLNARNVYELFKITPEGEELGTVYEAVVGEKGFDVSAPGRFSPRMEQPQALHALTPSLTPDGQTIVLYLEQNRLPGMIYYGDYANLETLKPLHKAGDNNYARMNPSISPDGLLVAFTSFARSTQQVYVTAFSDSKRGSEQLTQGRHNSYFPFWIPTPTKK